MALTQQERERLTGKWRELARRTRHFVADPAAEAPEFRRLAGEATSWASPVEGYADAFLLFGFGRLAAALSRTPLSAFVPRGRAAAHVAEVVTELLGPEPEDEASPVNAWWKDH